MAHVIPRIGDLPLKGVSPLRLNHPYSELRTSEVVRGGVAGQREPLSAKTVRQGHAVLSKALNDAVDEGLLNHNRAQRAKPPRDRSDFEVSVWTPEELIAFLAGVRDEALSPVWRLAAATGMRRGELVRLRWCDIDFEASTVAVQLTRTMARRSIVLTTPKNGRPRVINVDADTLAGLDLLRRRVPWARDDDFVALGPDGEPLHPDRLSQLFRKHVRQLGLKKIRLHDLRHTHASLLLKEGVPVKVVTERLGHADPGFTLRTYQHVLPGMQAAAAASFAEQLRVNHRVNRTEPHGAGSHRMLDPKSEENQD